MQCCLVDEEAAEIAKAVHADSYVGEGGQFACPGYRQTVVGCPRDEGADDGGGVARGG